MKHLWLILAFSSLANAGIRGIGNGGGYGEITAHALDKEIPKLMKMCAQQPAACGLNSDEAKLAQLYADKVPQLPDQVLQINKGCEVPHVHANTHGQVSIDSCLLYKSEVTAFGPTPKSAKEIAAVVMNARWTELKPPMPVDLAALTEKLLWQFRSEVQSNVFTAGGSSARLDIWSLVFAGSERKYLMLETMNESVDITARLERLFHCPAEYWALENIRFTPIGPNTTRMTGSLGWDCAKSNSRAFVALEFEIVDGILQSCESRLTNRQ